jgi:DNA adenine methylase
MDLFTLETATPVFPDTKYMGSKRRLLPFLMSHLTRLGCDSVLDAFSGSACVSHAMKHAGFSVCSNDLLRFAHATAMATVENDSVKLSEEDISLLLRENPDAGGFIQETFAGLYFSDADNSQLDHLAANISRLRSPYKRALALASVARACMKKRPRGLFTFVGQRGWDGRADLSMSMVEQFRAAAIAFSAAVFGNGKQHRSFNQDVFQLEPDLAPLVYIDTPYVSPFSDCDYTRRYHFVEGFCRGWKDCELMPETKTKKIKSLPTAFAFKNQALESFARLFEHFKNSKLAVSYSSNCIPNREDMVKLLKTVKKRVVVHEMAHKYHSGNHSHKVGDNNSNVTEYLFIAE